MISFSIADGKVVVSEIANQKVKREKGHSLLSIPSDYTVIDLETTGLNPSFDEIIEIACIKYRGGKEQSRFHSLVQPTADDDGLFVDDFITELTGITNDMLVSAPKFSTIAESVWSFLAGELIVGHNVNFDINFLYDNFKTSGFDPLQNNFVDTLRMARILLPELQHHRLTDLTDYFHIDNEHHRAVSDCDMTNIVLARLAEIVKEKSIDLSHCIHQKIDLRSLQGATADFVPGHMFFNKNCVFTGKLSRFARKDAAQLVANIGAHCENNVTTHTNFLIVGDLDYSKSIKDGKSTKLKKAESLILNGQDLQIITEETFYDSLVDSLN